MTADKSRYDDSTYAKMPRGFVETDRLLSLGTYGMPIARLIPNGQLFVTFAQRL